MTSLRELSSVELLYLTHVIYLQNYLVFKMGVRKMGQPKNLTLTLYPEIDKEIHPGPKTSKIQWMKPSLALKPESTLHLTNLKQTNKIKT